MRNIEKNYEELVRFRALMGCSVTEEKAKYIWGKGQIRDLKFIKGKESNSQVQSKLDIAVANVHTLLLWKWVKFIGVSGSVAAGFAKGEDDIDVFIVVRNGTAWLYRGIIALRNIFSRKIRVKLDGDKVMDKLCLNFICEERGLTFESDIFNFHELMYMIPIYNEKYTNYIYSQNQWLLDDYGVKKELCINSIFSQKRVGMLLRFLNWLAFQSQLCFMVLTKHKPEVKRLKENFNNGRIEFFNGNYKKEKIEKYLK